MNDELSDKSSNRTAEELFKQVKEYEATYIKRPSVRQRKLWDGITNGIEGIITAGKAPYVSKKLELPLVLIATPEVTSLPPSFGPLAEIISTIGGGGLGEISGALVPELDRQGVNARLVVPEYKKMFGENLLKISNKKEWLSEHQFELEYELMKKEIESSKIILVEDELLKRAGRVYDEVSPLDQIVLRKANAFQRGIISRMLPSLKVNNRHIIIQCNDWWTGIVPAAAKHLGIMSLMTVHNFFTYTQTPYGLEKHSFDIKPFYKDLFFEEHPDTFGGTFEGNYKNNKVNFMATGLSCADFINTVSPTILKEIVNDYFMEKDLIPKSLRDTIKRRYYEDSAVGILNAPSDIQDPRRDPYIKDHYWIERDESRGLLNAEEGRKRNKLEFQKRMGLSENPDIPIFFWPSRVDDRQKGFWLVNQLAPYLLEEYNLQIAVVGDVVDGTVDPTERFREYQRRFPGRISYSRYSKELSWLGTPGSDFELMPSVYEPCGMPPLFAPKYGTLMIGRQTGGLADSIKQLSTTGLNGNGFLFTDMDEGGFKYGIKCAMDFHNKGPEFRNNVRKRIMKEAVERFNIKETAKQYIEVYNRILERRGIKEMVI
jgi:starch synthase